MKTEEQITATIQEKERELQQLSTAHQQQQTQYQQQLNDNMVRAHRLEGEIAGLRAIVAESNPEG